MLALLMTLVSAVAPGWHTVGTGQFSWGEPWRMRVHAAPYDQQCINLVPQQPRERRCPGGPAETYVYANYSENPCTARAFVYGSLPPATARVTILHRMGQPLPARVRLLGGVRSIYFVAEVQVRAQPARDQGTQMLGHAVALDVAGRQLAKLELTASDVLTTMLCDAPSRPSRR